MSLQCDVRALSMAFRHSYEASGEVLNRKEGSHTLAGGIEGAHVEDVNTLHLSDELETLETGGLVDVGGNGTGLGTGGEKVVLNLDLCIVPKKIISTLCRDRCGGRAWACPAEIVTGKVSIHRADIRGSTTFF